MGLFDTFWNIAQQNKIDTANRNNSDLKNQNLDQEITIQNNNDLIHTLKMRIIELEAKSAQTDQFRVVALERKIKDLEEDLSEYKKDSRELKTVQQKNTPFNEAQKISTLAHFMIWEKSYKEQAISYSLALGKSQEEILQENIKFQQTVKNQKSQFGNNIPENILLDSEEYRIKQEERIAISKKSTAAINELKAKRNSPLLEDDSEKKYPLEDISENLADYEENSANERKQRALQKERREHEADVRKLEAIMKK